MGPTEKILIVSSLLLFISVVASKGASRFGVPALLVFLGIGILAGAEGPGGIVFHNYSLVQAIGVLALISILFSGGLDTSLSQIRSILPSGLTLSIFGVIFSAVFVGGFATKVLHFSLVEGLLLGAVVSATDVAAVFTVLRSKNVSLKQRVKSLLEFESAVNDPITVFLGTGLLALYGNQSVGFSALIPVFFKQMAFGGAFGYLAGRFIIFFINRLKLEFEGLYPVLTISMILFTYGITQAIGGSGFLAVYVAGIVLGNGNFLKRKSLILFHDGIAWLMQIFMFLAMGLIVSPHLLWKVAPVGMALSLFLVFVARPASVMLCLAPLKFSLREQLMVSWGGLRGAVPIILATYPLVTNLPEAQTIFHLVFFVVFTSVLLQGTLVPFVARWLGMDAPFHPKFRYPLEYVPTGNLKSELSEVLIPRDSDVVSRSLVELKLPAGVLVVLIRRGDDVIVPRGGTMIEADDVLLVLAEPEMISQLRQRLSRN